MAKSRTAIVVEAMIDGLQLAKDLIDSEMEKIKKIYAIELRSYEDHVEIPEMSTVPVDRPVELITLAQNKKLHPRDAAHPGHAAWVRKLSKVQKKRFDSLSPAEKEARQATLQAGRRKKVAKKKGR